MRLQDTAAAVDYLFARVKGPIRVGTPLGLGKPNFLLNELYRRVKADPSKKLEIFTALSLDPPFPKSFLEKRFYPEFLDRHFGNNYPALDYVRDLKRNEVPSNIVVREFYSQAGAYAHSTQAQQNYVSVNYTHAGAAIVNRGLNVLLQMVARSPDGRYSLSCNPDLTLDVVDLCREKKQALTVIGVVHPDLPFLGEDAIVPETFFDAILESESHELFSLPRAAIDEISHAIGFHGSQLVADGGTLQIGIGALSDALVHSLIMRQQKNEEYRKLAKTWGTPPHCRRDVFSEGLYGTSEMVMDGFMHLRRAGILKREVKTPKARYLHGAFFLGSKEFYRWLRTLHGEDFSGLDMTRVSKVNDLYSDKDGDDEMALRRQRKKARFFNTAMGVTLLGGACSDTLADGTVVSGVGGQYNFVAMSAELPDAVSVIFLRSTRHENGILRSNIMAEGGHLTIPRHLRDIVITEYGVADLRGKTDEECVQAMIEIADASFQEELASAAQKSGKLSSSYRIPEEARKNTRARLKNFFGARKELFPAYPFGSDFTAAEEHLVTAFARLKSARKMHLLRYIRRGGRSPVYQAEMARLKLDRPKTFQEKLYARLVRGALAETDRLNNIQR